MSEADQPVLRFDERLFLRGAQGATHADLNQVITELKA